MFKPEKHIHFSDAESNLSFPDVNPCPNGPQEWHPKNELYFEVAFNVHDYEIGKDEGVSDYPFRISNQRICKLHTYVC